MKASTFIAYEIWRRRRIVTPWALMENHSERLDS
jgi:hypothetical protein